MHLVLGSERVDLSERFLVIGRFDDLACDTAGADVAWLPTVPDHASGAGLPVGADASTVDDVHRLADAGGLVVGIADPAPALAAAADERGLTVLVPDPAGVDVAADRLVVSRATPVPGAVACIDLDGAGPGAWGRATVALAAGVRVVRTVEPRAIRRVAAVVERLTAAGAAS